MISIDSRYAVFVNGKYVPGFQYADYPNYKVYDELDITDTRYHHEIYLSDARKVAPEKLKTVIRHPIKKI